MATETESPMSKIWILLKYAWASPNTALGVVFGLVLWGKFSLVDGVIEIHGPSIQRVLRKMYVPAAAMTLGHVVIGQDEARLNSTRIHERVHVRQYERWGPLFLPAYFLASIWAWYHKKDPYRDNPFEVEAYDFEMKNS